MLLTYYALIVNWLVQGQQFFNSVRIYSWVNSYRLGYSDPKDVLVTTFSGLLCQGEVLQSCVARAAVLHFPLVGRASLLMVNTILLAFWIAHTFTGRRKHS